MSDKFFIVSIRLSIRRLFLPYLTSYSINFSGTSLGSKRLFSDIFMWVANSLIAFLTVPNSSSNVLWVNSRYWNVIFGEILFSMLLFCLFNFIVYIESQKYSIKPVYLMDLGRLISSFLLFFALIKIVTILIVLAGVDGVIISVHDVAIKILSSDTNYIVDVDMWPKLCNSSNYMRKLS